VTAARPPWLGRRPISECWPGIRSGRKCKPRWRCRRGKSSSAPKGICLLLARIHHEPHAVPHQPHELGDNPQWREARRRSRFQSPSPGRRQFEPNPQRIRQTCNPQKSKPLLSAKGSSGLSCLWRLSRAPARQRRRGPVALLVALRTPKFLAGFRFEGEEFGLVAAARHSREGKDDQLGASLQRTSSSKSKFQPC